MNYYEEIKNKIIDNEVYERVKDYSKERHRVITYFEIGKLLNEAGGKYGDNILKEYSNRLIIEFGKKYNERTLRRIRQYYRFFSNEKWSPLATKLSWSHYSELLSIKDENELEYYISICLDRNLSKRELREKIKSNEYKRLPIETRNKIIKEEKLEVKDLVPNPILISNKNNFKVINEKILKELILNNLDDFLSQLGDGFSYVGNEYRIKFEDTYNYIDLLLFNYEYNCFVVIELKVTELKKEHIGQIEVYMNYIDKNLKKETQDKTIGIIICRKDNQYIIEYCSDKRIVSTIYNLI